MTTAVKPTPVHAKPPAPAAVQPSKPATLIQEGLILLDRIDVVSNVRKKFDETAIKELADSIRSKGLINSITLRPAKKDGRYELVAGERRFRAAKLAGLKEIPARVLDLTDEAAKLYQVDENLHRKDLTPIEEARGFQLLTQPGKDQAPAKYTVKELAKLVDKSEDFVYRSMRLLELPAKAIEAIESGLITPAHGHLILKVDPAKRDALTTFATNKMEWQKRYPTIDELRTEIERNIERKLSDAKFPINKPYAGKMACTECPSNSGNQDMLIPGATKGRCFGPSCFASKNAQADRDFKEAAAARYEGLQFLGTQSSRSGWGGREDFKGMPIVGEEMKKLKGFAAAFKANPDKFGWGILTPDHYSSAKKNRTVLVLTNPAWLKTTLKLKDEEAIPKARVGQNDDSYERENFIEGFVKEALLGELAGSPAITTRAAFAYFLQEDLENHDDTENLRAIAQVLKVDWKLVSPSEDEIDTEVLAQKLAGATLEQLVAVFSLMNFKTWRVNALVKQAKEIAPKLPTDKIVAEAKKKGTEAWKAKKAAAAPAK